MAFDKDMWLYNDDFRAFVYESPAAELAATILGSPYVNLVINVLLCKEPHTPTVTSFHQDITGNAVEGPVCGMRMSLDAETPASGAMEWLRGSHKWNRWFIPYEAGADDEIVGKAAFKGYVDPDHPEREMEPMPDVENNRSDYDIVTTPSEPGDLFVSSLLMIHGAPGNSTDNRRRAFLCRFAGGRLDLCGTRRCAVQHRTGDGPRHRAWRSVSRRSQARGVPEAVAASRCAVGGGGVEKHKTTLPTVIDQNPCAHLRMPRDMIFHGWSMRLFQAWQHSATMSS